MTSVSSSVVRRIMCLGRQHVGAVLARQSSAPATRALTTSELCNRLAATPTSLRFASSSSAQPCLQKETVSITFKFTNGTHKIAKAKIGQSLLDAVLESHLDIDGYGACEGTLACSTCHLVFTPENFAKLAQKPTDEELDMLDLAYGLSDTSRLGCQVIVSKEMDGWEVVVPGGIADARG